MILKNILQQLSQSPKMGDIKKLAADLKINHDLALELWASGEFHARLLAVLIMDKKQLSQSLLDQLTSEMEAYPEKESIHLADWLMANQLSKDKKTVVLMASWENSHSVLQRRLFWYYQARLRWMGQTPPSDNTELLAKIESKIEQEAPEVQWAMNFLAGWIGVYDRPLRQRCVALGERTGLYKGKPVSRGCTPEYLPEFIAIESGKRQL